MGFTLASDPPNIGGDVHHLQFCLLHLIILHLETLKMHAQQTAFLSASKANPLCHHIPKECQNLFEKTNKHIPGIENNGMVASESV